MRHDGRHAWLEVHPRLDGATCRLVVLNEDLCRILGATSAAALDERDYFAQIPDDVIASTLRDLRFNVDDRRIDPCVERVGPVDENTTYFRTEVDFSIHWPPGSRFLHLESHLFSPLPDHQMFLLVGTGGEPHVVHLFRPEANTFDIELPQASDLRAHASANSHTTSERTLPTKTKGVSTDGFPFVTVGLTLFAIVALIARNCARPRTPIH